MRPGGQRLPTRQRIDGDALLAFESRFAWRSSERVLVSATPFISAHDRVATEWFHTRYFSGEIGQVSGSEMLNTSNVFYDRPCTPQALFCSRVPGQHEQKNLPIRRRRHYEPADRRNEFKGLGSYRQAKTQFI